MLVNYSPLPRRYSDMVFINQLKINHQTQNNHKPKPKNYQTKTKTNHTPQIATQQPPARKVVETNPQSTSFYNQIQPKNQPNNKNNPQHKNQKSSKTQKPPTTTSKTNKKPARQSCSTGTAVQRFTNHI